MINTKRCLNCKNPLLGKQRKYCTEACRKKHERTLKNLVPQPQNGRYTDTNPDKLDLTGLNLSGLPSVFSLPDLEMFRDYIKSRAKYEETYLNSCLPGGDLYNAHKADPNFLGQITYKYDLSARILYWIASQVDELINEGAHDD